MSYTTVTAFNGIAVSNLLQIGTIPELQNISASGQRLGADQPMFWVTGQRGELVPIELRKMVITQSLALADKRNLLFCKGRKVTILDQFAEIKEVWCQSMKVTVKQGAGSQWLIEAFAEVEAMPTVLTPPTTP